MNIAADDAGAGQTIPDIVADLGLFTGLADQFGHQVAEFLAVTDTVHQGFGALVRRHRQSTFRQRFAGGFEVVVIGHKVRLAAQRCQGHGFAVGADSADNTAFGGFFVGAFGQGGKTFLAKQVQRLVHVAVGFFQRLLAVHHSLTAELAQLHNNGSGYFCHWYCSP